MNRKGQTTIGGLFVAIFLFTLIIIGGFTFYFGSLVDNGSAIPDGVNETQLYASFDKFEDNISTTATSIDSNKSSAPIVGGTIDFFSGGLDSIKAGFTSLQMTKDYIAFTQKHTVLGTFLPDTFWGLISAILTIVIVFIVLGALWRYNLSK